MIKTCELCGAQFETTRSNKKFCDKAVHTLICKWCASEFQVPASKNNYYLSRLDIACCCRSCAFKLRYSRDTEAEKQARSEKRRSTCRKKYGVDNVSKSASIKQSKQDTTLKHYGVENPAQSEQVKRKMQQTNIDKYGKDNYFKTEQFKDKRKSTCLQKYGVEHPSQCESVKAKAVRTSLQKYGVPYVFQNEEVKKKAIQTNMERYGVPYACQNESIRQKQKDTCLQKYGETSPFKVPEIREKAKRTLIKNYGVDSPTKSDVIRQRQMKTCLKNHGVAWPSQDAKVVEMQRKSLLKNHGQDSPWKCEDVKLAYLQKTGYMYPSQNPEVKNASSHASKFELRVVQMLKDYDISMQMHVTFTANKGTIDVVSHEFDIYLPDYDVLIDCDGVYWHGLSGENEGTSECYDTMRMQVVPDGYMLFILEEGKEERVIKSIINFIKNKNSSAFDVQTELFNKCRAYGFPQPTFTAVQLRNSWNSLCRYSSDKLVPRASVGNTIVKHFHPSLYDVHVSSCPSVREAWNDDALLKKVILNRHVYVDPEHLTCDRMLQGFNISKVAPRASVFSPCWARYLANKYLQEFSQVFDPFSGFSGRALGVCSLGKQYIGQDLSKTHVKESNSLIAGMKLQNCTVSCKDVLQSTGSYECLLTCPPYDKKEVYDSETEFKSCDEWIDECLQRFNCKRYVFVVDKTAKYLDKVTECMSHTSYMSNAQEKVIVIDKE